MATITVLSNEDLTTLERGNDVDTVDMPESDTYESREYVLDRDRFLDQFRKWDRSRDPMLALHDELSRLEIWLSPARADKVGRAIEQGQDSVQLF